MNKTYDEFINALNRRIKNDDSFIYELVVTVVINPNRYTGILGWAMPRQSLSKMLPKAERLKK